MALNYWTDEAGNINFGAPPQGAYPTTQQQPTAQTAMPAPRVAQAPAYTGTNYATQLQGTLSGLQNQYAGGGAFDPSFYMARNADVAKAVQSGMFADPYQHYLQFGKTEGRTPNAGVNMLTGGTTPTMNYGAKLNNFGAGRSAPTFGSQVMPNQYQRRQTVAPNAWQGMTGSPFGGMYGGMATMPMMSFLQNSPYAALFGMVPQSQPGLVTAPPSAPQGFQIPNGTQVSAGTGDGRNWMNFPNTYHMSGTATNPVRATDLLARWQQGAPDQYTLGVVPPRTDRSRLMNGR